VPFEVTLDAQWFAFISKLTDRELAENEFWSFIVNDQIADTGVSNYRVSQADHVSFEVESFELDDVDGNNDDTEKDNESNDENDANDEEQSNDTEDNDEDNESNNEQDTDKNEETEQSNPNVATINKQVTDDLTVLKKEIKNRGLLTDYGHEPYVWAYAKAGGKVPATYRD